MSVFVRIGRNLLSVGAIYAGMDSPLIWPPCIKLMFDIIRRGDVVVKGV